MRKEGVKRQNSDNPKAGDTKGNYEERGRKINSMDIWSIALGIILEGT